MTLTKANGKKGGSGPRLRGGAGRRRRPAGGGSALAGGVSRIPRLMPLQDTATHAAFIHAAVAPWAGNTAARGAKVPVPTNVPTVPLLVQSRVGVWGFTTTASNTPMTAANFVGQITPDLTMHLLSEHVPNNTSAVAGFQTIQQATNRVAIQSSIDKFRYVSLGAQFTPIAPILARQGSIYVAAVDVTGADLLATVGADSGCLVTGQQIQSAPGGLAFTGDKAIVCHANHPNYNSMGWWNVTQSVVGTPVASIPAAAEAVPIICFYMEDVPCTDVVGGEAGAYTHTLGAQYAVTTYVHLEGTPRPAGSYQSTATAPAPASQDVVEKVSNSLRGRPAAVEQSQATAHAAKHVSNIKAVVGKGAKVAKGLKKAGEGAEIGSMLAGLFL